tara:strand:+ start:1449 stop:1823 length:375 start_codon:yes stop_codon:yes gene_type:complete
MEHQGEKIVEEIEVPVLDEDGNIIGIKIEKKISWGLPKGYSGPYYDETITDEDRLADAWDEVRDVRKSLLKVVDVYQGTLLYNSLTKTKQNQLAKYRQDLLDITNQESPEEAMKNLPKTPKWLK